MTKNNLKNDLKYDQKHNNRAGLMRLGTGAALLGAMLAIYTPAIPACAEEDSAVEILPVSEITVSKAAELKVSVSNASVSEAEDIWNTQKDAMKEALSLLRQKGLTPQGVIDKLTKGKQSENDLVATFSRIGSDTVDKAEQAGNDAAESLKNKAQEAVNNAVSETVDNAKESASQAVSSAIDGAKESANETISNALGGSENSESATEAESAAEADTDQNEGSTRQDNSTSSQTSDNTKQTDSKNTGNDAGNAVGRFFTNIIDKIKSLF